jgi:arabinofuranan 3-O-arabinosyltransferase
LFSAPLRTRSLDISFVRPAGSERVVVPELRLVGTEISRTLDPDTPTGAECGLGPNVRLNGQVVPTRVTGSLRDVANGTPLRFQSCSLGTADGTAEIENGVNRLSTEPTAEFDVLEVAGVPVGGSPAVEETARPLRVLSWEDSERVVTIGEGEESLLFLPENFNAGWEAELGGQRLDPLRVDGWQQAWVVPAGEGGRITLTYAPQRAYSVLLPTGLAVSGGVLLAGLVVLLGLRRQRPVHDPARDRLRPVVRRRGPGVVAWTVSAGATLVLLGPVVLVGLLVGASARTPGAARGRRRPTVVAVTAALVVVVVGSAVLDVLSLGAWRESTADALAALGLGLFVGLVLGSAPAAEDRQVLA